MDELLLLVRRDGFVGGFGAVQFHARIHVFRRARIELKNAILAAGLDGHIGDGHAVVHGKRRRAGAVELHGAIRRAVETDFADAMKDHVLGHHAGLQFAFKPEMHGLGHFDEQLARAHDEAGVGVADAGGELVERARHARVRVGAEQNFARSRVAFGRQRRVADARVVRAVLALQIALGGVECPMPFGSSITS